MIAYLSFSSPLGPLTLFEDDGCIISLDWGEVDGSEQTPLLAAGRDQLDAYFDGERTSFTLPLKPAGTKFQLRVWQALCCIPYGQAKRYGELAASMASSARAIGGACGRNPIPILIPCHRIVAADGRLGGYSGLEGITTKEQLLRLEGFLPV